MCVINAAGEIIAEFTIAHSADGITGLIRRLARYGDPAAIPIAIERPNGRLADLLLEAVTRSLGPPVLRCPVLQVRARGQAPAYSSMVWCWAGVASGAAAG